MDQARERFTYQGVCQLNLVLSHRKRVELNRRCNLHFRVPGAVYLPCPLQKRVALNAPQPMWIWPGLALLGCLPLERQGIRNGVEYRVAAINETTVTLQNGPVLTHEQAVAWLRLPYSMTFASVQGRETEGTLALHDCDNGHFTWRHLYVGLSRRNGEENPPTTFLWFGKKLMDQI